MALPEVRYARSGDVAVAYQVVGDAEETILYAPHLTSLYLLWQGRYAARFLNRLAERSRLIVFNPRGTGLSDRPRNVTLEARMDDVSAVLDAEGLERATLFGVGESANVCALYAATFPERCKRLALLSPYVRVIASASPRVPSVPVAAIHCFAVFASHGAIPIRSASRTISAGSSNTKSNSNAGLCCPPTEFRRRTECVSLCRSRWSPYH